MGKVYTPENVGSGFNTSNSLNTNFTNIETALEDTISRSGVTPNAMSANLDMNDNDLLNVGTIDVDTLLVDGAQVPSLEDVATAFTDGQAIIDASIVAGQADIDATIVEAETARDDAQTAQANAETAETNSETAQTAAEVAQAAAEAAAAGVTLPSITIADADKLLTVNSAGDAYETGDLTLVWEIVDTANPPNLSNIALADRTPGLYRVGGVTLAVHSLAVDAFSSAIESTGVNTDLEVTYAEYDSATGDFGTFGQVYESGVINAGRTTSPLGAYSLWKLKTVKV